MTDIIAVCVPDWYGVKRALQTYTSVIVAPTDALQAIDEHQPQVVVFGCYLPQWEPILLACQSRGIKTVLTWFASYILNEFDHTNRVWMDAALTAAKKKLFTAVAVPHPGLAAAWSHHGIPTEVLPLLVDETIGEYREPLRKGIHIGIFGSAQPWKNMECQIVAASMFGATEIHVHHLPKAPSAVTTFNIPVRWHSFLSSDAEYYRLMSSMTINMCVSLSETYSYFTAESLLLGVPVLTSTLTPLFHHPGPVAANLRTFCTTDRFEDPLAMVDKLYEILDRRTELSTAGVSYMRQINAATRDHVKAVRDGWLDR